MAKPNKYAAAALRAKLQTDEEYREVISKLTQVPVAQIEALFPKEADQQKVRELMTLVNSATSRNEQILKLKQNAEKFGALTIRLLALL
ncbi:hypothetical protein H7F15_03000 [Pontibacter sp. Tf4]|uniref:hypothetical protein n=1 Tax=Pontibacter sp. Tf4 TaxID=2761620 RepID=UPI001625A297|nr:hypothetical protein [Pontibacter sp. Tf4]MBB6609994.1 hypothetical protein [Pontibacter sp. Tf4]